MHTYADVIPAGGWPRAQRRTFFRVRGPRFRAPNTHPGTHTYLPTRTDDPGGCKPPGAYIIYVPHVRKKEVSKKVVLVK